MRFDRSCEECADLSRNRSPYGRVELRKLNEDSRTLGTLPRWRPKGLLMGSWLARIAIHQRRALVGIAAAAVIAWGWVCPDCEPVTELLTRAFSFLLQVAAETGEVLFFVAAFLATLRWFVRHHENDIIDPPKPPQPPNAAE